MTRINTEFFSLRLLLFPLLALTAAFGNFLVSTSVIKYTEPRLADAIVVGFNLAVMFSSILTTILNNQLIGYFRREEMTESGIIRFSRALAVVFIFNSFFGSVFCWAVVPEFESTGTIGWTFCLILTQQFFGLVSTLYCIRTENFSVNQVVMTGYSLTSALVATLMLSQGAVESTYGVAYTVGFVLSVIFLQPWSLFSRCGSVAAADFRHVAKFICTGYLSLLSIGLFSATSAIDALFIDRVAPGVYASQSLVFRLVVLMTSLCFGGFGLIFTFGLARVGHLRGKIDYATRVFKGVVLIATIAMPLGAVLSKEISFFLNLFVGDAMLNEASIRANVWLFLPMLYLSFFVKFIIDIGKKSYLLVVVAAFASLYTISMFILTPYVRNPFVASLNVAWYSVFLISVFLWWRVTVSLAKKAI